MRLQLCHVSQRFAGQTLFDIPDLSIASGELLRLHGHNGSGKSTLMKIMAGLQQPTTGSVKRIFDAREERNRQAVIYLHQQPYLFDTNVRANVEYGLKLRRENNPAKVDEALAWAQLEHIQQREVHHLSGGERQRLALARALVLSPQLILLDEPSSSLDRASSRRIRHMLLDLKSQGTGCLVACHHNTLMPEACDFHWYLQDGEVVVTKELRTY